ncbi:MAG: SDR family oxidoreductase [Rhodothermales bacterium]|nr:SDR family oxidoreductase [Rhodothermales bacterium]MBO6778959.1 SDR family oxidoreductase [Rhodothermales bacterium]
MATWVITGASQGIGAAISRAAAPGNTIALVARNQENLEAVAREVGDAGGSAGVFACDVTDDDAVRKTASRIVTEFGVPDVLVNNAGSFVPGSLMDTEPGVFRRQLEVNVTSAFLVTRAFLPGMQDRGSGHVLFMASVASTRGYPGGLAYCAAKHGLLGLARGVREETRSTGVRVTTLLPGATLTPSWHGVDIPEDRFMPAEDIAAAVVGAVALSGRTVVEEILLRPQEGDL